MYATEAAVVRVGRADHLCDRVVVVTSPLQTFAPSTARRARPDPRQGRRASLSRGTPTALRRGTRVSWSSGLLLHNRQAPKHTHDRARRAAQPPDTLSRAPRPHMRPQCDGGVSAPPRASMAAAAGRRWSPLTRRGSAASPTPASTSRGRMSRRKGERRGQEWACTRALWAGRARSSARRTVAAAAAAGRGTCRGGRRAPRRRKHPLRSSASARGAAGAAT